MKSHIQNIYWQRKPSRSHKNTHHKSKPHIQHSAFNIQHDPKATHFNKERRCYAKDNQEKYEGKRPNFNNIVLSNYLEKKSLRPVYDLLTHILTLQHFSTQKLGEVMQFSIQLPHPTSNKTHHVWREKWYQIERQPTTSMTWKSR